MTSEKYFEFSNHDGEYFLNEDTENILREVILENSFFVSTENYGTCNAMHIWTSHSTRFCSSRKSCFWRRYLFRSPPSQNAMTIIKLPSLLSNESWYPTMFGCFKVFSKSTSNWAAFLSLVEFEFIFRKSCLRTDRLSCVDPWTYLYEPSSETFLTTYFFWSFLSLINETSPYDPDPIFSMYWYFSIFNHSKIIFPLLYKIITLTLDCQRAIQNWFQISNDYM